MERLAAFIAAASGARDVRIDRYERMSGGAIQENFALDANIDGSKSPLNRLASGFAIVSVLLETYW